VEPSQVSVYVNPLLYSWAKQNNLYNDTQNKALNNIHRTFIDLV
jgi:hypothetical protein